MILFKCFIVRCKLESLTWFLLHETIQGTYKQVEYLSTLVGTYSFIVKHYLKIWIIFVEGKPPERRHFGKETITLC